jgi:hypothetical protein
MSGEDAGNNNGPDGGNAGADNGGEGDKGFQPITYNTQEELNAAFADRATRAAEAAKNEALKPLVEAGVPLEDALAAYNEKKAAEDAKKDPAVREREAHEQTQRELAAYKAKEARDTLSKEVAKELKIGDHPIPAELLAGTTKEAMLDHGKAIIAFIEGLAGGTVGVRPPAYNPDQGYNSQDSSKTSSDPIRNMMMTGSFQ